MAGKVYNTDQLLTKDVLGCQIANLFHQWDILRATVKAEWKELRRYVYATDTTQTSNSKLPWKNKTTVPKLCQIRDNLFVNYHTYTFPRRKWLSWEAQNKDGQAKKDAIVNYMAWVVSQKHFKTETNKFILDYIDYGNAFGMVEWMDERKDVDDRTQVGYVGPVLRRISPLDIVFNPTAPSFQESPKIIRSLVSIGEVKKILDSLSTDENRAEYEELYNYLLEIRQMVRQAQTDLSVQDDYFNLDGFTTFRSYLESDYVEILTFYGDIFSWETKELLQNHVIMVVDRHKVIAKKPNPSMFGHPPIYHVGWRPRQDNLWAMGPLSNLIGLQYRIDHIENLKADVFDLLTFPVLKIKGYVEDFTWGPMERIVLGDGDSDVEMIAPPFQILQANVEIQNLMAIMEEMAGAPKEALGFRTPGEKTAYEVSRLENAASRIFQHKSVQLEEFIESLMNSGLELASRNLDGVTAIPVFDDEFSLQEFQSLTASDITGIGTIRPVAARHFTEKAERIQNLTNLAGSPLWATIAPHVSTVAASKMIEDLLDLGDYEIIKPYIQITEQADAQRLAMTQEEQTMVQSQTPSGLTPDDYDPDIVEGMMNGAPPGMDEEPQDGSGEAGL